MKFILFIFQGRLEVYKTDKVLKLIVLKTLKRLRDNLMTMLKNLSWRTRLSTHVLRRDSGSESPTEASSAQPVAGPRLSSALLRALDVAVGCATSTRFNSTDFNIFYLIELRLVYRMTVFGIIAAILQFAITSIV